MKKDNDIWLYVILMWIAVFLICSSGCTVKLAPITDEQTLRLSANELLSWEYEGEEDSCLYFYDPVLNWDVVVCPINGQIYEINYITDFKDAANFYYYLQSKSFRCTGDSCWQRKASYTFKKLGEGESDIVITEMYKE